MMTLVHKEFGLLEVRFDFYDGSGILGAFRAEPKIAWESVVAVIGYPRKPGFFGRRFGIAVAFQQQDGDIQYGQVISTSNEWEYRYFLEKTVAYMTKNLSAIGGDTWCARRLTVEGEVEENDLYRSYDLCRIVADKLKVPWFEHSEEDEAAVALTFITKRLVADGTEDRQLSQAMDETRFLVDRDGSVSMFRSVGFRILADYQLRIIKPEAQGANPSD